MMICISNEFDLLCSLTYPKLLLSPLYLLKLANSILVLIKQFLIFLSFCFSAQ